MEEFLANVPWGILKIEAVGGDGDIPDQDPCHRPVSANEACVTVSVLHGDFGEVRVRIGRGVIIEKESIKFSGVIACPTRVLEISDVVGDTSYLRMPVSSDRVELVVGLDKSEMAEAVTVRVKEM
ncbi:hypothetical protein [Streptomyces sp. NBC_01237]|uniref:hypothetical protein n=1 Tax=Streptomyces sp. NBC_01237 TaxID=2903790 RepID=UPI002DDC6A12|nr:hypothetical protein [Streptomyces sp. NBC_01237]WRZ78362.1 hypothetical protein OG251_43210 [Streptomyces sp. NBC_01237]